MPGSRFDVVDAAGRAVVALTFIYWGALKGYDAVAALIGATPIRGGWDQYMAANGVPYPLIAGAILIEVVGGVMLALGYRTRLAALALAAFCVIANFAFHTNWTPPAGMANWAIFVKNFALAGALLVIAARRPGRLSLDRRGHHDT
ncbi:MAG TPA: DoxX family protein [Lysobacter sp.]|nr:DoxX family protein [Lysobacter sp.]